MPRAPRPLPESLGHAFAVQDAIEAGASRRRLRHSDLSTPIRGLRELDAVRDAEAAPLVEHAEVTPLALEAESHRRAILRRARAYASIAPLHSFFCLVTAAVIWGLPLPIRLLRRAYRVTQTDAASATRPEPRDLDLGVFPPHRGSKASGIHGRRFSPAATGLTERGGMRVTDPATTWANLASELSIDELVRLGDAIVRVPRARGMERGDPATALGTIEQLRSAIDGPPRRRGAAKLRAALGLVRVGSSSPGETDVRLAIGRAGLPDPALDYDVFATDGRPIGYTELAYPEYRVLIEYEGDHHRTDRKQWNRDIDKHAACVAAGWDVVRLTSTHVYPSSAPAVERIRAALIRGGWGG